MHRLEAALTKRLGGALGLPAAPPPTRYIAAPCPGTLALIAPVVVAVVPFQRSETVYEAAPLFPTVATSVLIVWVEAPSLNSTTATSPLDRRLASTSSPLLVCT